MRRRGEDRLARGALNDWLGAAAAGLVTTVFCLLLLQHERGFFWYDDYQISILPVFADVARSWSEGNWPLLSPYSWACSNLAGEFQYGTFSIFVNAAVVSIWKLPLQFAEQAAALSIAHLFVLAAGGYMLARGRELEPGLAMMVALVAALNGWMIAWGASDWFGALAAFAWLPWSWWALERSLRGPASIGRMLLPGIFIYLLIAGGFPYTVLMLVLVTGWLALRAFVGPRKWHAPLRLVPGWLVGIGLSAPGWISLLDYAPGSRRAVEVFPPNQWMVPFASLPGFVLPSWIVPWAQFGGTVAPHFAIELACGLAPVVVLIGAVATASRRVLPRIGWELALMVVVLAICMLPSAGMFRFSFRSLALLHVVLALAAAEAYRAWRGAEDGRFRNGGTWALLSLAAVFVLAPLLPSNPLQHGLALAMIFAALALLWWVADRGIAGATWLLPAVTFVALLASYLAVPVHSAVAQFGFNQNLNEPWPLEPNRLYLSLYQSPPVNYKGSQTGDWFGTVTRPGSTSMFGRVHLINGYTPVGPAGIARLLDLGTHGNINPPRVGEIVLPEAGPDGLLVRLGIDGIIVARDFTLAAPLPVGWHLAFSSWEGDVWHRDVALPHVRPLADDQFGDAMVKIVENSRQRVIANVTPVDPARPVVLAFSRAYFPGYRATLNGKALPVTSLQRLAPAIQLPAGAAGRVELVYRPRAVTLGGAISGLTAAAALAAFALLRRRT